jgi:hypothetical protein
MFLIVRREASYLLTSYLSNETHGRNLRRREENTSIYPDLEYDPNWPFNREEGDVTFRDISQDVQSTIMMHNGAYGGGSSTLTHGEQQRPEKEDRDSASAWNYPDVILELGSGMGSVGLVAAETMAILYSSTSVVSRTRQNGDLDSNDRDAKQSIDEKTVRGSTVVLTDLPEVCTLMEENMRMQMEEWEKRQLDNLFVVQKDSEQRGPKVKIGRHQEYLLTTIARSQA